MHGQRTCGYCVTPLKRKPNEKLCNWQTRKYCDTRCRSRATERSWADADGPPWVENENGCWIWNRAISDLGYGQFGKSTVAHRWVYEQAVGPIPDGQELDHVTARGCRSRACVNPAHLEPVTHTENVRRGMNTKLNLIAAREIRDTYAARNITLGALAEEFGVSVTTINRIVRYCTWKE